MKTYVCKEPIELTRKDFNRINDLLCVALDSEEYPMQRWIDELDARRNTMPYTFWWNFEDGSTIRMDIESNDSCYSAFIYRFKDISEDEEYDPQWEIYKEMTFYNEGDDCCYVCKIKIMEEDK